MQILFFVCEISLNFAVIKQEMLEIDLATTLVRTLYSVSQKIPLGDLAFFHFFTQTVENL